MYPSLPEPQYCEILKKAMINKASTLLWTVPNLKVPPQDLSRFETSTEASERVVNEECDDNAMTSPKTQDAHAMSTSVGVSIKVVRLVTSTKVHSSWYKMHRTGVH